MVLAGTKMIGAGRVGEDLLIIDRIREDFCSITHWLEVRSGDQGARFGKLEEEKVSRASLAAKQ